jgi:hypothetical protein
MAIMVEDGIELGTIEFTKDGFTYQTDYTGLDEFLRDVKRNGVQVMQTKRVTKDGEIEDKGKPVFITERTKNALLWELVKYGIEVQE